MSKDQLSKSTTSSADWDLAFTVVKRMFAQTIGLDLVPVVPMSAPSGTLFYHDTVYEDPPLDILKRVLPKWRADRKNEILENKVREYLDKAIPGLSNQTIDNAIEDDAKMDHLIWLQSTSNEYGI
jgi:hypothetical protein